MIRRILVFLAVIFVAFFVYRRYDSVAADSLLSKIRHFSFKGKNTTTTTITNSDGTTTVIDNTTIGSSGFKNLVEDTLSDKNAPETGNDYLLIQKILTSDNLKSTSQQPVIDVSGLTGGVVENRGPIETLRITPVPAPRSQHQNPRVVNPSEQTSSQLSAEDKSELQKFLDMFSN